MMIIIALITKIGGWRMRKVKINNSYNSSNNNNNNNELNSPEMRGKLEDEEDDK